MSLLCALARSTTCSHQSWAVLTCLPATLTNGALQPLHQLRLMSSGSDGSEACQIKRSAEDSSQSNRHTGPVAGPTSDAVASASPAKVTALTTAAAVAAAASPSRTAEVISELSTTINRLTGYESIDHLKGSVVQADKQLQQCKQQLQAAKVEYDQQLAKQSQLHREVTALLQRKSSWVPADVARFTDLYAAEHATEKAVESAKARYTSLSDDAERLQLQLVDLIRERYQQEQLWSDKIRRASTWWTWGLMGLHFASFVMVYTFLEPRKRAALQTAIADMLQQHAGAVDAKLMHIAPHTASAADGDLDDNSSSSEQQRHPQHNQRRQLIRQQQQPAGASTAASEGLQDLQQHIVQELQAMRQQLSSLQQAVPSATAMVGAAEVQQQQQQRQWHLPGSRWAAQQLTAAGQATKAFWDNSRHRLQQLREHYSGQKSPGKEQAAVEASLASSSSDSKQTLHPAAVNVDDPGQVSTDNAIAPRLNEAAAETKQQAGLVQRPAEVQHKIAQQADTAPDISASGLVQQPAEAVQGSDSSSRGLLQQLRSSERLLEVTRGQLAAVAACAGAVGSGLAVVLVVLLSSSRGAGSSS